MIMASLVGSELCIRDRLYSSLTVTQGLSVLLSVVAAAVKLHFAADTAGTDKRRSICESNHKTYN